MDECCGTCKWHKREPLEEGWFCTNENSDCYSCWTDYKDFCPDWEDG